MQSAAQHASRPIPNSPTRPGAEPDAILPAFERLKAAYKKDPQPSYEQRMAWLDQLLKTVRSHRKQIADDDQPGLRQPLISREPDRRGLHPRDGHSRHEEEAQALDEAAEPSRGAADEAGAREGALPAARRRRHHLALELPGVSSRSGRSSRRSPPATA